MRAICAGANGLPLPLSAARSRHRRVERGNAQACNMKSSR
jgi:hypothetical protein